MLSRTAYDSNPNNVVVGASLSVDFNLSEICHSSSTFSEDFEIRSEKGASAFAWSRHLPMDVA